MTEESEPPDRSDDADSDAGASPDGADRSAPDDATGGSEGEPAGEAPASGGDDGDDAGQRAGDDAGGDVDGDAGREGSDDAGEEPGDGATDDAAAPTDDAGTDPAPEAADPVDDDWPGGEDPVDDEELYHPADHDEAGGDADDGNAGGDADDDDADDGGLEPHPDASDGPPGDVGPQGDDAFDDMPGPTGTMEAAESDVETGYGNPGEVHESAADAPGETPTAAGDGGETPGVHQEVEKVQDVPTPTPPGAEEPEPVSEYTEPPDDEELPLTEHIEEMVKRLGVVLVAAAVVTVVAFPLAEDLITVVWYHVHPGTVANCPEASQCTPPHVYGPLELKLAELKLASLAGIVAALPVFVYESYLFMRPGLYPQERRYYLAAVPTSLVLALVGVAFSYFLVLPALFTYFLYYSQESVDQIAFALRQTFDLIMMMLGFMAVVFQIPLFIMLAIMMGITTRAWLASRRLYFWGAFAGIAFLFSPDPTGMAPIIVAATMVTLFEGTLLLLKWAGR